MEADHWKHKRGAEDNLENEQPLAKRFSLLRLGIISYCIFLWAMTKLYRSRWQSIYSSTTFFITTPTSKAYE